MLKKGICALLSAAVLMGLSGCGGDSSSADKAPQAVRVTGQTMGTFYQLTVPGSYPGGSRQLQQDAEQRFNQISSIISTFDKNSELSRFNQRDTKPLQISTYLAHVIEEVNRQSLRIGGAVELSVGPLVNLWGFGPDGRPEKVPTADEIAAVREYVGRDKYAVTYIGGAAFLEKKDPRVQLDLSTVGEGLGVDELAAFLDEQRIPSYLVSIAGASRSRGVNPEGRPWRVGIVNPVDPDGQPFAVVCPQGMAMSTSGSYRNYFVDEKTGKRFSHIIDPATGQPVDHHTVSVTVIARNALITDTLDTGLMVLGADQALAWGDSQETPVYVIEMQDGKPVGRYNRYFEPYLKCDLPEGR